MEEDYDDYIENGEEEESKPLILSIGEDGKAEIHKPENYVEMKKEEAELIRDFIQENKELFDKFIKGRKHG